jgi:hypothetical protein
MCLYVTKLENLPGTSTFKIKIKNAPKINGLFYPLITTHQLNTHGTEV